MRVRKILMELNRAVCLDQPEAGVPWFHVKYCEEQHALGNIKRFCTYLINKLCQLPHR